MIVVLRDMLADTLLIWAGKLIVEPDEDEAFARAMIPLMKLRLRRYQREMPSRRVRRS